MTDDAIAALNATWLDRKVRVRAASGTHKRFDGLVGTVKAVNWSGRCLVEFDHGQDIGWYDLEPAALVLLEESPEAEPGDDAAAADTVRA